MARRSYNKKRTSRWRNLLGKWCDHRKNAPGDTIGLARIEREISRAYREWGVQVR